MISMSRRKQSKPQCVHMDSHVTSSQQLSSDNHIQNVSCPPPDDVHVCGSCSAEYFSLSDLLEHQMSCSNSLVLLESESPSSAFTFTFPIHNVAEQGNDNISTEGLHNFSNDKIQEEKKTSINKEKSLESSSFSHLAYETNTLDPVQTDSLPEPGQFLSTSSNVFIENLESTKVAVAQFSQEVCLNTELNSNSLTNYSLAIPNLIEQLVTLQQQQVQQLNLTEQIRHQLLMLSAQNTNTSVPSSACQGISGISQTKPLVTLGFSLTQQLAEAAGLARSLASLSASINQGKQIKHAVLSSNQDSTAELSLRDISQMTDTNGSNLISRLGTYPPEKQSSHDSTFYRQPSITNSSPSHAFTTDEAPNLPSDFILPHSAIENYIFANKFPNIGEIVEDLNALTALAQKRNSNLSKATSSEHKRPFEGLLKHKCRFCSKVFGSDSALKIHLRSHTGERPYKCNICRNRFSTRGNLKVHFQRHKEKYPNIQMNPYPVPEHLDNVPTSTGIPYGMSLLPDKLTSKWLDSKPSVTVLPGLLTSFVPSLPSIIKRETKVVPIGRSSSPGGLNGFEAYERGKNNKEELQSNSIPTINEKNEDIKKYLSFATSLDFSGNASEQQSSTDNASINKNPVSPLVGENFTPKCPLGSLSDSVEYSETNKPQPPVVNINEKCIDPSECTACHRVLSCPSPLKMHYCTHSGERPFKCKVCGRSFTTRGNLKTHFSIHHVIPPSDVQQSWPLCQDQFRNAVVLQQHIHMHTNGQIHSDALQGRYQKSIQNNSSSMVGKNCDENFPDKNLEIIESVSDSKNAECPLDSQCLPPTSVSSVKMPCLENLVQVAQENDLLIDRLENVSVEEDCFTIKTSGDDGITQRPRSPTLSETSQEFLPKHCSGLDNYMSHDKTQPNLISSLVSNAADIPNPGMALNFASYEQETPKSNACDVCNKTFTCQSALDIHYRSHTKERPFLCTACNRGFSTKGNLKQHMLTHQLRDLPSHLFESAHENLLTLLNPAPPTMEHLIPSKLKMEFRNIMEKNGNELILGFQTFSASALPVLSAPPAPTRRISKQYFCHTCGKTFSSSSALQIHERTHTGEKPFACTICGRAFTTKGNLKVHMGTHMWNASRRGRRLSTEGPLRFLKSSPVKVPETQSKDTVRHGESVGVWNEYVTTPLTTSLALKSNEISVIKNGSIPHLSFPLGNRGNSPIVGLTASLEKPHNVEMKKEISWPERLCENGTNFYITPLIEESKTD